MVKGKRWLVVLVRRVKSCAEIWIHEEQPGFPELTIRETFEQPAECEQWLMNKKAELEAAGWRTEK